MSKIFICGKCNVYESINELSLKKHSKQCNGNFKGFTCPLCFKLLMSKVKLGQHFSSNHHGKILKQCPYCLKDSVLREIEHYRHEEKCFNNPKNSFTYNCLHCRRKYLTLNEQEKHISGCIFKPIDNINEYSFNKIKDNNVNSVGVYIIVSPNGSTYIGMTNDSFKNRWNNHLKLLLNRKHHCIGLQRAYNKYGWDNLSKEIIEEYSKPMKKNEEIFLGRFLLVREKELWEEYKYNKINLYNSQPTGTGSIKLSEESKEKGRMTLYFNRQSYCKIYINKCSECKKIFSNKIKRKTCSKECFKNLKSMQRLNRDRKNKNIIFYLCAYEKCCNYLSGSKRYCGELCKSRNNSEKGYFVDISEDVLYDYYINKLWSTTEIAQKFNSNHMNVRNLLKKNNIPIRNRQEGLNAKQVRWVRENIDRDEFIENYKKYSLNELIRNYKTTNISRAIDEYIKND